MTKEQFRKSFISVAPYISSGLAQIPFIADDDNFFNEIFMAINLGVGALLFYLKCRKLGYMNTPEYKEYVALYDDVVSDIAKMYSELGFKGDFSTSVVFKHCLENGIFSLEPVKYTLFESDKEELYKYCGGRVATGKCCCRHNASLLADVLTEMGGISPKVSVYFGEETDERKIYKSNHLVTGVLLNDKRVLVDPTTRLAIFGERGIYKFDSEYSGKMTTAKSFDGTRFYLMNSFYAKETDNGKSYREFMKHDSVTDLDELIEGLLQGTMNACRYNRDFVTFHNDEKPKILQLAKLSEVVAPHGKKVE